MHQRAHNHVHLHTSDQPAAVLIAANHAQVHSCVQHAVAECRAVLLRKRRKVVLQPQPAWRTGTHKGFRFNVLGATYNRAPKHLMQASSQPHNHNQCDTQHVLLGEHNKRRPAEQTSQDGAPAYRGKPESGMNVLVAKQLQALLMALQLLLAGRAPAMT